MGAVRTLDLGPATDAEPQRRAVPGASEVAGLAGSQPLPICPGPQRPEASDRYLRRFHLAQVDIPPMVELFQQGRLPLDQLVSASYKLDDLGKAFEDMEAGKIGRGVVIW